VKIVMSEFLHNFNYGRDTQDYTKLPGSELGFPIMHRNKNSDLSFSRSVDISQKK
jgi:hypothetical protein